MVANQRLPKQLRNLSILFFINGLILLAILIWLFTGDNKNFLLFLLYIPLLGNSSILAIIFYLILLILVLLELLDILLSFILPYVIYRKATCSYKLAMTLSILMIIRPPIGTIIGIPSLIIINKNKSLFIIEKKA